MSSTDTDTDTGVLTAGTWTIDPAHTTVGFRIWSTMSVARVDGRFDVFTGALRVAQDGAVDLDGTVEVASVDTNQQQRDAHLRSPDFFAADAFPQLAYRARGRAAAPGGGVRLEGELTMKGVTRPLVLEGELLGGGQDPQGHTKAALAVRGALDRFAYGISFGGPAIDATVELLIDASLIRADDAPVAFRMHT